MSLPLMLVKVPVVLPTMWRMLQLAKLWASSIL
jgi:hypothetical protein